MSVKEEHQEIPPQPRPRSGWRAMIGSFGVLTLGEAVARMLSFGAIAWMSRRLSLDGFGLTALGGNLILWFAVIVNTSTQTIGLRDAAREPHRFKAIIEPLLGVRLVLSGAAMIAFGVIALIVGRSADDRLVLALFALALPILSLNLRFSLLALGSAGAVAAANVASQLAFLAVVVVTVSGAGDAIYVPVAQVGAEFVFAAMLVARVAPRFGLLKPRFDATLWRRHMRETGPLMVAQVGRATITWFDSLLIALMLGQGRLGLYAAAYKPILFVSYSLSLLFVSFLAVYAAEPDEPARLALLRRTLRGATLCASLAAVALTVAAAPLVKVLFGARFADAALPMALLGWTIPLSSLSSIFAMVLISDDQQALVLRATLVAVAADVTGNLIAVPTVGIAGAAATALLSWTVLVVLNYRNCLQLGLTDPLTRMIGRRGRS